MKYKNGSVIKVKINPRSPKNEISGVLDDGTIKIKLTAPPVDGKANQSLIKFLSEYFCVDAKSINIISGQTSHTKLISIEGVSSDDIMTQLKKCY
jgi:uncharacterized protein (TIGR00251 family)